MTGFVRFPSTPYLVAPKGFDIRADKVLGRDERARLLSQPLRVEEKIDGQNLGISSDGDNLLYQSRGSWVELGGRHFQGLDSWVRPRTPRLNAALGTRLVLFGEWAKVTHSVRYDQLPDWFLVFDVFDRRTQTFWEADARDAFSEELGLATVPLLAKGSFGLDALHQLTEERSRVGSVTMEGVVLRALDRRSVPSRAKLVRRDFVQQIGEHWMKDRLERNQLVTEDRGSLSTS